MRSNEVHPLVMDADEEKPNRPDCTPASRSALPALDRHVLLGRYLVDCHRRAWPPRVLRQQPSLESTARQALEAQDALLIAERLQAWTDAAIAADLEGYPEVDPAQASRIRDRLLRWLKALPHREGGAGG